MRQRLGSLHKLRRYTFVYRALVTAPRSPYAGYIVNTDGFENELVGNDD